MKYPALIPHVPLAKPDSAFRDAYVECPADASKFTQYAPEPGDQGQTLWVQTTSTRSRGGGITVISEPCSSRMPAKKQHVTQS